MSGYYRKSLSFKKKETTILPYRILSFHILFFFNHLNNEVIQRTQNRQEFQPGSLFRGPEGSLFPSQLVGLLSSRLLFPIHDCHVGF